MSARPSAGSCSPVGPGTPGLALRDPAVQSGRQMYSGQMLAGDSGCGRYRDLERDGDAATLVAVAGKPGREGRGRQECGGAQAEGTAVQRS